MSKTLTKVSSPATVGLYSSCQNRLNMILGQMEALIGTMLFYRPIWTEDNQQHHNVRFIYVHFSAWHFAGSDLLWAGLAIRLFQAMQMSFGKLQIVLYRVAQHDEEMEVQNKRVEDGLNHWRSKKVCCCPLWFLLLSILMVPLLILVFTLTFGLPNPEMKPGGAVNGTNTSHVGVFEGLIIASIGLPAASALRFVFQMVKNLIFSQDQNIRKGMDNERVSSQLGFMNDVRKEMWFLSQFIQFMEVFERRRIRVVLKITNLDRCSPKKIVAVLDAINILLSDEESPYISILSVDPDVLVQKVNFADGCFSKQDRAYALLNGIVTLAFTVPPLGDDSKRTALDVKDEEVEKLVRSILNSNERNLNKYMLEDAMSMRRVINSIRVTVIIMKALQKELPRPEYIAAWVVLANQWPCRLSWILQCVEDAQQRADIELDNVPNADDSKTLWKVFQKSRAELYVMSAQIEDLLEQDGDPEMFERFLTVDFKFTVKDLKTFEGSTVNLDHSIRKELAHIRGTSRLKDSGWMRNLAPLPITTIINMDTEDVCKELERLDYHSKYNDIVRRNNLNGSALLFGDTDDLKELLQMTFGEWTRFRLHFLGVPSRLRPPYKNMAPTASHPQANPSGFHFHMPNQYSSNPNLVNGS
ncbi:hypothetical protein F7725_026454, partial [Dissostichus mawsoni]